MIRRNAVRAILLRESDDCLLLVKMRLPDRNLEVWVAPGGGVESGEAPQDGLFREVYEETGLRIDDCEGPVWLRRHRFALLGTKYDQHEQYYVVRTPHFEPDHSNNPASQERELFDRFRWWSLDEIKDSDETFVPRRLAHFLEQLILTGRPEKPIDVGI